MAILKHSLGVLRLPHVCILTTYFGWISADTDYEQHAKDSYASHRNPFTVWERYMLLELGIEGLCLNSKISIIVAPRHDWNWEIVSHFYPPNRIICLTNKDEFEFSKARIWTKRGENVRILDVSQLSPPLITTTEMKRRISSGECWKKFMPESTHKYFESIRGPSRLFGIQ
jgi:nicotinamide mononucleotide adenylyltransferase